MAHIREYAPDSLSHQQPAQTILRALTYPKIKGVERAKKTPQTGETKEKFLKNFSSHQLTGSQVSVISKGLKFIPTPVRDGTKIRHQLLQDFEQFARRMRQYVFQYIFHGQTKEPHPFHVKSNWMSPVQPSVALESNSENVKVQLAASKTEG